MSQEKEDFIRSEVAVKVLENLESHEDGNYSTQIAEELDKTQSSISRILSELKKKGIVQKGKRTKAQFYELDYDGLVDYWYSRLETSLEQEGNFYREEFGADGYTSLSEFRDYEDEIKEFSKKYFQRAINISKKEPHKAESLTLFDLLYTSYAFSLAAFNSNPIEDLEEPEYFKPLRLALVSHLDIPNYAGFIFFILTED